MFQHSMCVPIVNYGSLDVCLCLLFQQVEAYQQLSSDISWFFFDLFVMGYVEDESTGLSFFVPPGKRWSVYIEVSHHMYNEGMWHSFELIY